ncbi:MAG: glycosyltransferase family 4 protein [Cyanophyceae cyanobacterium]
MPLLILCSTSFAISLVTVALIRQRWGQQLLDIPNERSSHAHPTPRGGGLGFIIAFALTSVVAAVTVFSVPVTLWLVLIPLTAVGILDDRQGVPAGVRYAVQLATAAVAVAGFGIDALFPQATGVAELGAIALTLIGFTALINFYNFMDGLDGLVAGTTAVQLGFLAFTLNQPFLWLLVAALLGFLRWNWSPAQIFMGDAGSTVLGATVAAALLNSDRPSVQAWSALVVTFPLMADAVYTLGRRLWQRENIFRAHRTHLYQRLQQSGWSHGQVASTYIGITVLVAVSLSLGAWGAVLSSVGIIGALIGGELLVHQFSQASADV